MNTKPEVFLGLFLCASARPISGLAAHVHHGVDHDLVLCRNDLKDDSKREAVEAITAETIAEQLPSIGVLENDIDPSAKFFDEFEPQLRSLQFVKVERLFQLGFGGGENDRVHRCVLALRRAMTSSTG